MILLCGFIVGVFIGSVGIGGVLLVPVLVLFAGLPIRSAVATALFSFVFTGIFGSWLFARRRSIAWKLTLPVCIGSLAFGYLGTLVGDLVSGVVLSTIVAVILLIVGAVGLLLEGGFPGRLIGRWAGRPVGRREIFTLLGVGGVAGFGAGLSGAGGPLFSVPMMLALGFDPLLSIGTAQSLQIVASISASVRNVETASIEYNLALTLAMSELFGVFIGVYVAHTVSAKFLHYMVATACLVCGGVLLANLKG